MLQSSIPWLVPLGRFRYDNAYEPAIVPIIFPSPIGFRGPSAGAAETQPKLWIDPRLVNLPPRSWRKIQLGFHHSQYIARIGEKFNADEFVDTLIKAEW